MKIGYARVSKHEQHLDLQLDALQKERCERIFTDKMTGSRFDRPDFERMLDVARPGDTIVVWRLDRLGRSLKNLIETVMSFEEKGIELRCLTTGQFDTTTSTGKLIFHIFAALAEFERELIRERTLAGLEAARARGKRGGRKKATETIPPKNLARAKELYAKKEMKVEEIMQATGIPSKSTFYAYVVHGGDAK